jgi:dienelactone hydrolase
MPDHERGTATRLIVAPLLAAAVVVLASACGAIKPTAGVSGPSQPTAHASASPAAKRSSASPAAQAGVGVMGRFKTGLRQLTFTEPAHTGPTGEQLGPRSLLTNIRYPLASGQGAGRRPAPGPLPLIVFGPGFQFCDHAYGDLLRSWASAGYVVAAVNFPLSDCLTGAAATESDLVNQPGDISYVITSMLRLSRAGHGLFAGRLDPRQIAIAGQSDGGDTVTAVAANTCCTDHRVRAVAVLSGAQWPLMPGKFFSRRPVPMLFTQGSADTVNLPGCSAAMYHADPAQARYYLDLFGENHTGPYWGTNRSERVVARVTLAFFNRYVLKRDSAGPAMRRDGDVPGTAALFSHGEGHVPPGLCVT